MCYQTLNRNQINLQTKLFEKATKKKAKKKENNKIALFKRSMQVRTSFTEMFTLIMLITTVQQ